MVCKAHGQNRCDQHYQPPIGSPEQKVQWARLKREDAVRRQLHEQVLKAKQEKRGY